MYCDHRCNMETKSGSKIKKIPQKHHKHIVLFKQQHRQGKCQILFILALYNAEISFFLRKKDAQVKRRKKLLALKFESILFIARFEVLLTAKGHLRSTWNTIQNMHTSMF